MTDKKSYDKMNQTVQRPENRERAVWPLTGKRSCDETICK